MLYFPLRNLAFRRYSFWRIERIARDYRVNERIRAPEVMVIADDGEQVGVMTVPQALTLARGRGLDLVEVQPNGEPPVCRILDYGRLRYLSSKKEREAKKAHKNTPFKEVRFRTRIGNHDFQSKLRKVKEFIDDGSKVKVAVVFRGREVTHRDLGVALLKRVADDVEEVARVEGPPSLEGRFLSVVLAPGAKKIKKETTNGTDAQTENAQGS